MNPVEQNIKNRFADEALPPSPAGQDALWSAIEGQMSGQRKRAAYWWWMGGLLIAGLSFTAAWYTLTPAHAGQGQFAGGIYASWDAETFPSTAVTVSAETSQALTSLGEDGAMTSQSANETHPDVRSAQNHAEGRDAEGPRATSQPSVSPSVSPAIGTSSTASTQTATSDELVVLTAMEGEGRNASPSDISSGESSPSVNAFAAEVSPLLDARKAGRGGLVKLPPIRATWPNAQHTGMLQGAAQDLASTAAWYLRVYTGPNWSRVDFADGYQENANSTQRGDFGWGGGLGAQIPLRKALSLNVGVEYQQYFNRFDYENTTVTPVIVEDQVQTYYVSGETGDTLNVVYGPVEALRTDYRRVLHHNRYQVLSFPLGVSFERSLGWCTGGVALEGVLHVRVGASGRGFDADGDIVDYTRAAAPQAGLAGGWQVRPYLGVQLSSEWRADVALAYGGLLGRQGEQRARTQLGGVQLGLVRKF